MLNVEFLIVAYIVCMFIDWVFQSQEQADYKSKWNKDDDKLFSLYALITHSNFYALTSTIVLYQLGCIELSNTYLVFFVLFITHAIIDTRIPVKWIMKLKGLTNEQIKDVQTYGFMHVGIDHRLHELVLLVLACVVK